MSTTRTNSAPDRLFERYVAIGDSSTEGLDDPLPGGQYRGWANRLAERVAAARPASAPPLLYANLAVRGLRTRQVLERQLHRALDMRPDLATVFAGTNDVIGRRFDPRAVGRDLFTMQSALVEAGATVLSFTLPDLSRVMPLAQLFASRVTALNQALRRASADSGAILVDLAAYPVAGDPRLWSRDRLHANSDGHERIARALAHALDLPEPEESAETGFWAEPLPLRPAPGPSRRLAAEISWIGRYLLPWLWRHARGVSSGDGLEAKRPTLAPLQF